MEQQFPKSIQEKVQEMLKGYPEYASEFLRAFARKQISTTAKSPLIIRQSTKEDGKFTMEQLNDDRITYVNGVNAYKTQDLVGKLVNNPHEQKILDGHVVGEMQSKNILSILVKGYDSIFLSNLSPNVYGFHHPTLPSSPSHQQLIVDQLEAQLKREKLNYSQTEFEVDLFMKYVQLLFVGDVNSSSSPILSFIPKKYEGQFYFCLSRFINQFSSLIHLINPSFQPVGEEIMGTDIEVIALLLNSFVDKHTDTRNAKFYDKLKKMIQTRYPQMNAVEVNTYLLPWIYSTDHISYSRLSSEVSRKLTLKTKDDQLQSAIQQALKQPNSGMKLGAHLTQEQFKERLKAASIKTPYLLESIAEVIPIIGVKIINSNPSLTITKILSSDLFLGKPLAVPFLQSLDILIFNSSNDSSSHNNNNKSLNKISTPLFNMQFIDNVFGVVGVREKGGIKK